MLETLVLVGLGNPGTRYESTRHNMGFLVVDAIAEKRGLRWIRADRSYYRSAYESGSTRVVLVKPQTYMNRSGEAVGVLCESLNVGPEDLLVIVDDIALPLGTLRLRRQGSDGGHNGLKSVIDAVETTRFARLRIGIGPVAPEIDPADFVLSPFPDRDRGAVRRIVRAAVRCVDTIVSEGYDRAMERFNAAPGLGGSEPEGRETG